MTSINEKRELAIKALMGEYCDYLMKLSNADLCTILEEKCLTLKESLSNKHFLSNRIVSKESIALVKERNSRSDKASYNRSTSTVTRVRTPKVQTAK